MHPLGRRGRDRPHRTGAVRIVLRSLESGSAPRPAPRHRVASPSRPGSGRRRGTHRLARPTMGVGRHVGRPTCAAVDEQGAVTVKLIYALNMSLDGYTEDAHGAVDWAPPDDDVFAFITDLMGSAGTYLYGRRMYESMAVWETEPALAEQSDLMGDFAHTWQSADKVVYSTTLAAVSTAKTRLERSFDPDAVRDLKAAATTDLLVGGPNLAAQA